MSCTKKGVIKKDKIYETFSSAIDIIIPYNFWRYLYFCVNEDAEKIKKWSDIFNEKGIFYFDKKTIKEFKKGFLSNTVSDKKTTATIKKVFEAEKYLLDPHGAVSLTATQPLKKKLGDYKLICLATAHPAKFPKIIKKAIGVKVLPEAGIHHSIESAKIKCQRGYTSDHSHLEEALIEAMEAYWDQKENIFKR